MKQAVKQWSNEDMQKIYQSFDECARVVDHLGRKRKNKKREQEKEA